MLGINHLTGFGVGGGGIPGDPYWGNVKLLIQPTTGDGAIVDHGPLGKSLTPYGNVALSTTTPWAGCKSVAFDGAGDYLSAADSDDWRFDGDFTLDVGYYDTSPSGAVLLGQMAEPPNNSWGLWSFFNDVRPQFLYSANGSTNNFLAAANLGANAWRHLSVQRAGTSLSFYQQFSLAASATLSSPLLDSPYPLVIGSDSRGGPNPFSGYIAYIRITKGVARYSGATIPALTGPLPAA